MTDNGEVGGSAGIIVAILLLTGGIISIATKKFYWKRRKYCLDSNICYSAFLGFALAGGYSDLKIWAGWCLINVIMAVLSIAKKHKN